MSVLHEPEYLTEAHLPSFEQKPKNEHGNFKSTFTWLHWRWEFCDNSNLTKSAQRAYAWFMSKSGQDIKSAIGGNLGNLGKMMDLSANHLAEALMNNKIVNIVPTIEYSNKPAAKSIDPHTGECY